MPWPGVKSTLLSRSAYVVWPWARRLVDDLLLGRAGRRLDGAAEDAGEDEVGRAAEDLRPDRAERDADDGQHEHDDDLDPVRPQPAEQALGRRAEVQRLLARLAHLHVRRAARVGPGRVGPRRPSPPRS